MKKFFIFFVLFLTSSVFTEALSLPCSYYGECRFMGSNIFIKNNSSKSCTVAVDDRNSWVGTINPFPSPNSTTGVYLTPAVDFSTEGSIEVKCLSNTVKLKFQRPFLSKNITAYSQNSDLVKLDRCESGHKKSPAVCYFEILP